MKEIDLTLGPWEPWEPWEFDGDYCRKVRRGEDIIAGAIVADGGWAFSLSMYYNYQGVEWLYGDSYTTKASAKSGATRILKRIMADMTERGAE